MSGRELSVLIPAFNEAGGIRSVVEGVLAHQPQAEIIVCDDGSTDGTSEALEGLPIRVVRHRVNRGYGAAWKTLASRATGRTIVFFDGDGQFDPADIARVAAVRQTEGHDMVSAARTSGEGRPLGRRPGKWVLRIFANWFAGSRIPDVNCGLRAFDRRTFLPYLTILPDGFSCSTTSLLAYLATGRDVGFVDIAVRRRTGTSSVRMLRDGLGTLLLIVRLTMLLSPMRVFLPTSLLLMLTGIVYSVWEALARGLGVPVLGATLVINGLIVFLFGLLSDQVSALRLERLQLRPVESIEESGSVEGDTTNVPRTSATVG
jgi:glycosyltransferase involved in cell wall biosynthesis